MESRGWLCHLQDGAFAPAEFSLVWVKPLERHELRLTWTGSALVRSGCQGSSFDAHDSARGAR